MRRARQPADQCNRYGEDQGGRAWPHSTATARDRNLGETTSCEAIVTVDMRKPSDQRFSQTRHRAFERLALPHQPEMPLRSAFLLLHASGDIEKPRLHWLKPLIGVCTLAPDVCAGVRLSAPGATKQYSTVTVAVYRLSHRPDG